MVVVAEAEPVVARLRFQLDPVARLGVPAHVTVLFPFIPASGIRDDVMVRLAALFRPVPAFTHNFVRTAWFGDQALWLDSDAARLFRSLTQLVWSAFPAYPPFEGRFDEVVPHLTIADHGPFEEMQAAERRVQRHLPISAITQTVTLMVEQPSGRWDAAESFPLNG
jgi:2'-5' RNA ligase superfamily protein